MRLDKHATAAAAIHIVRYIYIYIYFQLASQLTIVYLDGAHCANVILFTPCSTFASLFRCLLQLRQRQQLAYPH